MRVWVMIIPREASYHSLGVQELVDLFLGHDVLALQNLTDRFAGLDGSLGDIGRLCITQSGANSGDDTHGALHQLTAALFIGGDAGDAVDSEGMYRTGQSYDGLKQLVVQHRLSKVQLQLAGFRCHGDGHIVADNEKCCLGHDLGDNGVDLAGHDGGAVLLGRQVDLLKAAAGTGGHKAEVVSAEET